MSHMQNACKQGAGTNVFLYWARVCVCVCAPEMLPVHERTQTEMKLWGKLWKQLINSWVASASGVVRLFEMFALSFTVDCRLPRIPSLFRIHFYRFVNFLWPIYGVAERVRKMSTRCKVVSTSFHAAFYIVYSPRSTVCNEHRHLAFQAITI